MPVLHVFTGGGEGLERKNIHIIIFKAVSSPIASRFRARRESDAFFAPFTAN